MRQRSRPSKNLREGHQYHQHNDDFYDDESNRQTSRSFILPTTTGRMMSRNSRNKHRRRSTFVQLFIQRIFLSWKRRSLKKRLFLLAAACLVLSALLLRLVVLKSRRRKADPEVPRELLFGNVTAVAELYQNQLNGKFWHDNRHDRSVGRTNDPFPTIFYNIFLPDTDDGYDRAVGIVEEQLQQIVQTLLVDRSNNDDLTVFGIVIGRKLELPELCSDLHPNLHCLVLQHYENATETVTLQALYEHCAAPAGVKNFDGDSQVVVYLHSKGSYHDNAVNAAWRRALTAAALLCSSRIDDDFCNLCGLQFYTQFTMFVPGNMWAADCAYVRQLLPPASTLYLQKRQQVVQQFLLYRLKGHMKSQLLRDRRDYFGLDRYAVEHWIGSHPDLRPCDMDPVGSLPAIFRRNAGVDSVASTFNFSLAPRHPGFAVTNVLRGHERLHAHPEDRLREYYLLPGHLLKWNALYDARWPVDDSWVWKWFPDGDLWRDAVKEHGALAVEHATATLALKHQITSLGYNMSGASTKNSVAAEITTPSFRKHHDVFERSWLPSDPSGIVIFFHIVLGDDGDGLATSRMQLETVNNMYLASEQTVTVFFNVVSDENSRKEIILGICAALSNINCHPMSHLDRDYRGETLQHLYEFCRMMANPHQFVVYINNNDGATGLWKGHPLLKQMTMAATSELCLKPSKDACNVCGLAFYTMWTLFFPGNMFSASCSYVKKLIPPIAFEDRLEGMVGSTLLAKLRQKITSNLILGDRIDYWGLGRFAMDHWIASHPDLVPCDLAPVSQRPMASWGKVDFAWSMAPRHIDAPFSGIVNSTAKSIVLSDTDLRRRENQFLAGKLLMWYQLYGRAPPPDSWVWEWFPDGELWREGVTAFGERTVEALTHDFANDGM